MSDLHRPTVLNSLLFFANNTAGFCFFNCLGRLYAHNDWLSSSRSGSGWRERSTVLSLNLIRSELTGNRCSRLKVCSMLLWPWNKVSLIKQGINEWSATTIKISLTFIIVTVSPKSQCYRLSCNLMQIIISTMAIEARVYAETHLCSRESIIGTKILTGPQNTWHIHDINILTCIQGLPTINCSSAVQPNKEI